MTKRLCLTNAKGGVNKTTATLDIGYWLGKEGKTVLFVDMDPQCNLTYSTTGQLTDQEKNTLFEVLITQEKELSQVIAQTQMPNVYVAPSTLALSTADALLGPEPAREMRLKNALDRFEEFSLKRKMTFDYVLIDTGPSLGVLTTNAIVASGDTRDRGGFLVPVAADLYATIGISHLKKTLAKWRKGLNMPLPFIGAFATMYEDTNNSRRYLQSIKAEFGDMLFQTMIPKNIRVSEANNGLVLFDYAPDSTGAVAYSKLTKEIMQRVEGI